MYYGYIYKTTNLVNGKIYIGQHKGKFDKNYLGSGFYLRNAINKYGKKNFSVVVLCICETFDGTNDAEFQYIEEHNSIDKSIGYNLRSGGMQPGISEDTRKKMSKAKENYIPWNKGIPRTEELKQTLSEKMKGRFEKENNHFYGKKHSEETKQKMKEAWKKRKEKLSETK